MAKGPKITDDERAIIVGMARQGKSLSEIVAAVHRSESTVRGVLKREGVATRQGGVYIPPPSPPQETPSDDSGGLAAALASASGASSGDDGPADPEPDAGPAPQPGPQVMDAQAAGKALVVACDAITVGVCRVYAVRQKVKITGKLSASWRLSAEEKAGLQAFAPYAAPYILALLKHFDKIAAGVFAVIYASILSDRFETIKELSPIKEKKDAGVPPTGQPPAPPGHSSLPA